MVLLRTRLGCVEREFHKFIRQIKLRGSYMRTSSCAYSVPPGQVLLIAARFLVFAWLILEPARADRTEVYEEMGILSSLPLGQSQ